MKGRNLSQAASMMWVPKPIMYFIELEVKTVVSKSNVSVDEVNVADRDEIFVLWSLVAA